jgi:hypothetical protein
VKGPAVATAAVARARTEALSSIGVIPGRHGRECAHCMARGKDAIVSLKNFRQPTETTSQRLQLSSAAPITTATGWEG